MAGLTCMSKGYASEPSVSLPDVVEVAVVINWPFVHHVALYITTPTPVQPGESINNVIRI
jgi:hypothetical protein